MQTGEKITAVIWAAPEEVEALRDQRRPLPHDDERDDGESLEPPVEESARAVHLRYEVIVYLENLIGWVDKLFRRDTMESIYEESISFTCPLP
jgi:hypothetical protein